MRIAFVAVSLAALLAGCQTGYPQGKGGTYFYTVPDGARLMLNQPLTIPAHQRSIYIQDGQVQRGAAVRRHYPFCRFELYTLSESARTVAPDTITVTRTAQEETTHGAAAGTGPLRLAQLPLRLSAAPNNEGGPSVLAFSTRMALHSEKQPDIYRLTCTHWGFPGLDRHLTIAEIRGTLEPLFTLHLPGPAAGG